MMYNYTSQVDRSGHQSQPLCLSQDHPRGGKGILR